MKELFKDLGKYLPSAIVPSLVGIIALPVITRLFPPSDYGSYILVINTVTLFTILAVAWLGSSIVRFLPIYEQNGGLTKFHTTTLKLTTLCITIFCVLFWVLISLARSHMSPDTYSLLRIGILFFVAASLVRVFTEFLRAKRQAGWYSFFTVWHSVIGLGLGIAIVTLFDVGVEGLLWGSLISITVVLPLLWKVSMGKPSLREGSIRSGMTWQIAKYGIPAVGINLLTWALSLSDRYMLQFFRSSEEVGIYSASYNISEQTIFLITSLFLLSSAPIAYDIWEKKGVKASQEFVNKLTRYYLLVSVPAAVGLSVLAKPISEVFLAPEYLPGYKIIPVVAMGALLVGFSHRYSLAFGYYRRNDLNMACFFGAMALNVGLNFVFIPSYGYIAAGSTTFFSYAFLLFLEVIISRRFFIWKFPFKSLAKATLSSVVMAVVVYPIGNSFTSFVLVNLILGIIVGIVVYSLMIFLLREPQKEEIQEIHFIKAKFFKRSY